jgi:dipeptidyl aminopeptidase/acylaminoacyl peptidase
MHYTDSQAERIADTVRTALPGQLVVISASTTDRRIYLIHTSSDVNPGTYYLDDVNKGTLQVIGQVSSRIVADQLPHMRNITYPAKDGTRIPGYLTVPLGVRPENLPLVVMPHGGPIARDRWEYFFLRDFLANRGYAVLQMNFRGSSGYGEAWYHAAHQDWGGLTYSDIVDGTAWAIKQGIADPKRVCVVGWSFGGYAALLSATRDSALYRCAVSIAGVSDLSLLLNQTAQFMASEVSKEQIGTDKEKLAAGSPRRHADAVTIPILLVHGDKDPQVNLIESEEMAQALKRANKPYELLVLKDADHQIERETDRAAMLTAIEKFLLMNLGPGVNPTQ